MNKLKEKLKLLPVSAGVYFHKDLNGNIIYIGKAANLKNRVRSYFQSVFFSKFSRLGVSPNWLSKLFFLGKFGES